jgi:hypothetical protein
VASKFDLLQIGWLNMFLVRFFEGIMNLAMKMFDCVCGTCCIQNIDWGRRSRSGDLSVAAAKKPLFCKIDIAWELK